MVECLTVNVSLQQSTVVCKVRYGMVHTPPEETKKDVCMDVCKYGNRKKLLVLLVAATSEAVIPLSGTSP